MLANSGIAASVDLTFYRLQRLTILKPSWRPFHFSISLGGSTAETACYPEVLGASGSSSVVLTAADRAAGEAFARLVAIMRRLRGEGGCPWDREQTMQSLKPYLIEESYEVLDAIDRQDMAALREELGDLLLQPVFHAQIAADEQAFTVEDSLNAIVEKLIRRHPHVFGDVEANTSGEVLRNWEQIKQQERAAKAEEKPDQSEKSMLDAVPRALPALLEAQRITSRVGKVGFDWPSITEVEAKLEEELAELAEARESGDPQQIADEFGDILFVMANMARFLKLDAEQSLRGSSARFRDRFAYIEERLAEQNKQPHQATLEEMEALWQEAKHRL